MSASEELDYAMKRLCDDEGWGLEEEIMCALSSEGLQLRDEAGAKAAPVSLLGIIYRVSLAPYDRITPRFFFYQHLYQILSNINHYCCIAKSRFCFLIVS